jgi:hypothetical protein
MGGGSTTAKTASYVLVAADAGTVVQMNSASATTITVNTALFAAGDTVQIQNIGAGVCTVTAGTATVSTSATLALKQYDAGTLYFNTTSAALFFAVDAADGASPLTTKGDVFTFSTVDARLAVGANDTVLTADSAQATGLKWATPSSGGMAVISSGSLSSTALTISSISGSYLDLQLVIRNFKTTTDGATLKLRINGDTNTRYRRFLTYGNSGALAFDATDIQFVAGQSNINSNGLTVMDIPDYTNTTSWKTCNWVSANDQDASGGGVQNNIGYGVYNQAAAITSLTLTASAGTMTGTYTLYGVK